MIHFKRILAMPLSVVLVFPDVSSACSRIAHKNEVSTIESLLFDRVALAHRAEWVHVNGRKRHEPQELRDLARKIVSPQVFNAPQLLFADASEHDSRAPLRADTVSWPLNDIRLVIDRINQRIADLFPKGDPLQRLRERLPTIGHPIYRIADRSFLLHDMAVAQVVQGHLGPLGESPLVGLYIGSGGDAVHYYWSTNALKNRSSFTRFVDIKYRNITYDDLQAALSDPQRFIKEHLRLRDYRDFKQENGFARQEHLENFYGDTPGLGRPDRLSILAALLLELETIGIDLRTIQPLRLNGRVTLSWGSNTDKSAHILQLWGEDISKLEDIPPYDVCYQRAVYGLSNGYVKGDESYMQRVVDALPPHGLLVTDDYALSTNISQGYIDNAAHFPNVRHGRPLSVIETPQTRAAETLVLNAKNRISDDPLRKYGWHVRVRARIAADAGNEGHGGSAFLQFELPPETGPWLPGIISARNLVWFTVASAIALWAGPSQLAFGIWAIALTITLYETAVRFGVGAPQSREPKGSTNLVALRSSA